MARDTGGSNFISIGVAILAVGLFLGWLATREPPQPVVVAEPDDTAIAVVPGEPIDESQLTVLDAETMSHSARLDDLTGQAVRMNGIPVAGRLGEQMFWAELSSGDLYLVKLDDALVAAGTQPPSSGTYDLIGRIEAKNAARVNEWMRTGALQSEDQRVQAEFGLSYLEAQRVIPAGT
jgi:hypothetical protein